MRFACWVTKATDTHSDYVILITFPRQQWLRERALILCYSTYISCLVVSALCTVSARNLLSVKLRSTINHAYVCVQELLLLTNRRLGPDIGHEGAGGGALFGWSIFPTGYVLILTGSSKWNICFGTKEAQWKTLYKSHKACGLKHARPIFFSKRSQPLLRAASRAARVKMTISGTPRRLTLRTPDLRPTKTVEQTLGLSKCNVQMLFFATNLTLSHTQNSKCRMTSYNHHSTSRWVSKHLISTK
jgi:hypothetical protein